MDNSFRFVIDANPEPDSPSDMFTVTVIELVAMPEDERFPTDTFVDGRVLEVFGTDNPYGAVEAAREAEVMSFEERYAPFGPAWEDEQRERMNGGW